MGALLLCDPRDLIFQILHYAGLVGSLSCIKRSAEFTNLVSFLRNAGICVGRLPDNLHVSKDVRVGIIAQTGSINDATPHIGILGLGSCFIRVLMTVCPGQSITAPQPQPYRTITVCMSVRTITVPTNLSPNPHPVENK